MIEHLNAKAFPEAAKDALGDQALRGALKNAMGVFAGRRVAMKATMPDWEELREAGRAVKEEALANLDGLLEEFERNVVANGGTVHWARTGEEACAIVAELARERGARRMVKSKSMTTEEIGLNHVLEAQPDIGDGTPPVETDLGEWIIQLAGELPSHIIAPAIHKSRGEIGRLFVDKLKIPETDDPAELTAIARERLRRYFAEADMGISGVNFGVAETGSILVLENEGNARMTTTLPRVHVAMMGIEKVVPRFEDLALFLRLLPRSGTGQHLTSYQSILTGVQRADEHGAHDTRQGPEELHVVLLDNGRSQILADDAMRQSLACIRCGACLNVCPVYKQVGGHAYGSVYPGPIGAIITPQLGGLENADTLPYASSLCGACGEVCPVKIDIPAVLLALRSRAAEGRALEGGDEKAARSLTKAGEHRAFRLWAWAMRSPRRYRLFSRLARHAPGSGSHTRQAGGLLGRLAPALAAWTSSRDLGPVAKRSFRELWDQELSDGGKRS